MNPTGHKELTAKEIVDKLAEDKDDPLTQKIVANTVDMNARHVKKMLKDQGAYRMLDADNEASSEELGSDSQDSEELADD